MRISSYLRKITCLAFLDAVFLATLFGGPVQSSGGGLPPSLGWYDVPSSTLLSVCPPDAGGYLFSFYCKNVIKSWSGGVADTKRNRLIIWGGGHNDYYGNEVYGFDLNDLHMKRLNNPSPITNPSNCVTTLSDGTPNSRHTYGGLAYIAHADKMFVFGGAVACANGTFALDTWTLDMATLQWRRMAGNGGPPSSGLAGVTAAYDPGSRKVFLQDRNSFWSYDYDSDHYTVLNKQLGLPLHMNAVIDSSRKLFILFGDGHIFAIRIAPGSNYSVLDWTGAKGCDPLANESAPGLAFDSEKRVVAGWPNFGGTVYLFNPDSRACSAQIFGNGPRDSSHQGTAPSSAGTYGRFQYFPSMGVYALVSDADADAQLLRLTTRADSSAHAPTAN